MDILVFLFFSFVTFGGIVYVGYWVDRFLNNPLGPFQS